MADTATKEELRAELGAASVELKQLSDKCDGQAAVIERVRALADDSRDARHGSGGCGIYACSIYEALATAPEHTALTTQERAAVDGEVSGTLDSIASKLDAANARIAELESLNEHFARDLAQQKDLRAEVGRLQALVPHPGDGTCERCGTSPSAKLSLCHECREAPARLATATALLERAYRLLNERAHSETTLTEIGLFLTTAPNERAEEPDVDTSDWAVPPATSERAAAKTTYVDGRTGHAGYNIQAALPQCEVCGASRGLTDGQHSAPRERAAAERKVLQAARSIPESWLRHAVSASQLPRGLAPLAAAELARREAV